MEYEFVIGTNAGRDITITTIGSVMSLYKASYKFGWDILGAGGPARARNIIASKFLKANQAPYLIFIDRDMLFTPKDIGRLLDDLKNGYDLVAGCYAIKGALVLTSGGNGRERLTLDGTIKEVKYLATGFMGISRNLLEKMVTELKLPVIHARDETESYPFFEEVPYNDPDWGYMWLSEDYDFCHKARQVGVKSYLDTGIWLGHIGDALWRVDGTVEAKQCTTLSKEAQEAIGKIIQKETMATKP